MYLYVGTATQPDFSQTCDMVPLSLSPAIPSLAAVAGAMDRAAVHWRVQRQASDHAHQGLLALIRLAISLAIRIGG